MLTNRQRATIRTGHLVADLLDVALGLAILGVIAAALGGCSMDMEGLDAKARLGDGAVNDTNAPDASAPDVHADAGIDSGPLRPLGAGCTTNDQCTSSVCAKNAGDSAGMCCDHPNDECTTCVGGYNTPVLDGTKCGAGSCDTSMRHATNKVCQSGVCGETVSDCCAGCGTTPGSCSGDGICACGSGPFGGCP